jgi:plasmid stabilization system protein ParE
MARLRWTPQALDDIEAICKFMARDSAHFAHLFANKVFEKAKTLEAFPDAGRIVPESNQEMIREIGIFHRRRKVVYTLPQNSLF